MQYLLTSVDKHCNINRFPVLLIISKRLPDDNLLLLLAGCVANISMATKEHISPEKRAYVLLSKGINTATDVARETGISRQHVYRIWKQGIEKKPKPISSGRPRKVNARTERKLIRTVQYLRADDHNWRVNKLMKVAQVEHVHKSTVCRVLNRNGYSLLQSRKKGLMSAKDKRARVKFARDMLKREDSGTYWISGISFYLDAVGFVYKRNPREQACAPTGRCWRKRGEGLQQTAKGSACGTGGKYVKVIACISHGKGVVWASTYDKMTGKTFATFVKDHFNEIFKRCGKPNKNIHVWLQDGCKCQNSRLAKDAMQTVEANMIQSIPARSPDLNPIENVFNVVKKQLREDAIQRNIEVETKQEFEQRVLQTLRSYPSDVIDRTIESMEKRLQLIRKSKGERLKY